MSKGQGRGGHRREAFICFHVELFPSKRFVLDTYHSIF